jgi:hypothetical protein
MIISFFSEGLKPSRRKVKESFFREDVNSFSNLRISEVRRALKSEDRREQRLSLKSSR